MAETRTCWNCKHGKLCFVFRNVKHATGGVGFLNIDGDSAPGRWRDIFATLAAACSQYSPREEER
jgi:hypothetical protein